jgi:hypothetical protein
MGKVIGGKNYLQVEVLTVEVLTFGLATAECWRLEAVELLSFLLVQLEFFPDWILLV